MGQRSGSGTTLRQMGGATPGGDASIVGGPGPTFDGAAAGGEGDEPIPDNIDPKRQFNEVRMMKRLMAKKDKELEDLRQQFASMSGVTKKMQALEQAFGGGGGQAQAEGEPELSAYELASRAHQRMLDTDPDSGGMPLTLRTAKEASDGWHAAKEMQKKLEDQEQRLKRYENPMYIAEQALFVNLDGGIRDIVAELYGNEDNYGLFEQVAIKKIAEKRKDPLQWRNFVRSPGMQQKFMQEVVESQIPRAYAKRGSADMTGDDYSLEQAKIDNARALSLRPNDPERSALLTKSRRKLLPEMLGIDFGGYKR